MRAESPAPRWDMTALRWPIAENEPVPMVVERCGYKVLIRGMVRVMQEMLL